MRTIRDVWRCEICGHEWLAINSVPPQKCAKCKSRRWHTQEIAKPPVPAHYSPVAPSLEPEADTGEQAIVYDADFGA